MLAAVHPALLMVIRKRGFLVMGRRELPDFKTTPREGFGREVERGRALRRGAHFWLSRSHVC
jgi:hypothetical protein